MNGWWLLAATLVAQAKPKSYGHHSSHKSGGHQREVRGVAKALENRRLVKSVQNALLRDQTCLTRSLHTFKRLKGSETLLEVETSISRPRGLPCTTPAIKCAQKEVEEIRSPGASEFRPLSSNRTCLSDR